MERESTFKEPDSCNRCIDEGICCYRIPFIKHSRIVYFKDFNIRTFSLDSIEECTFRQALEDPIITLLNTDGKGD